MSEPTPLRVLGLHHIALVVPDVKETREFCVQSRGFRSIARPDLGFHGAWIQREHLVIQLLEGFWAPDSFQWMVGWDDIFRIVSSVYNLRTAGRFYTHVLGAPVLTDDDWVGSKDVVISLIADGPGKEPGPPNSRGNHVAFGVSDLDRAEQWLKYCGTTSLRKTQRGSGIEQIFLVDPDDHTLELNPSPMP
jgi:catechol 2,3-dioxygenase-like lactoylglutathione lyase family enzyme